MRCDACPHTARLELVVRRIDSEGMPEPDGPVPLKLCGCCARTVNDTIKFAAISLAINGTIDAITKGCPDKVG